MLFVVVVVVVDHLQRSLSPCALSQDFVEVESHGVLGNQSFNLILEGGWQNPHQGLGSETVFGALFVITLFGEKIKKNLDLQILGNGSGVFSIC